LRRARCERHSPRSFSRAHVQLSLGLTEETLLSLDQGDEATPVDPPADWMEKLPPHIREKVHAVVYEGWPKEEDLLTVEGKPNQTQALIEECGKAVSASWTPTKTFVAVGSPESWGVVASVTAPPGWALLGDPVETAHNPEDYTHVTRMNSLNEYEKKRIKEGTAWFVNGCKYYASEDGLDEIVTKSTPWVKRGYRVTVIVVETGRIYSLQYMNATNQFLMCREEKLLEEEAAAKVTAEQKKILNSYHAEYFYKAKKEATRLAELSAFLLEGPTEVLDSAPPTGEEYPGGPKVALYPKVTVAQVRKELAFDEYKEKELTGEDVTIKEGVFEYKDRLVRVVFSGKTNPSEVGCARPVLQAKETELLVPEIDGKKLNLSEQQRKVLHSYNKCAFLRAKADVRTFTLEFARLVTTLPDDWNTVI